MNQYSHWYWPIYFKICNSERAFRPDKPAHVLKDRWTIRELSKFINLWVQCRIVNYILIRMGFFFFRHINNICLQLAAIMKPSPIFYTWCLLERATISQDLRNGGNYFLNATSVWRDRFYIWLSLYKMIF